MSAPAFDFADAFRRTGWDRRTAAAKVGVSLGTIDRALDAGKWSANTERLFRLALRDHVEGLAPYTGPALGERVLVPLRLLGQEAVLKVRPIGVSRLLAANLLDCDDLGRLFILPNLVTEALTLLRGNADDGLDNTIDADDPL